MLSLEMDAAAALRCAVEAVQLGYDIDVDMDSVLLILVLDGDGQDRLHVMVSMT
jgi:hypothetical protein